LANWRPISLIEPDSSSAATAAVSTFVEASFEADTAPSALFEVCPELLNRVVAVDRIALAPSATVFKWSSAWRRNAAIAWSITARRCCCSCIDTRSRSASRRSVMSSCVATQPPSGIGRLMTEIARPSFDFTSEVLVLPADMVPRSSRR
jgi:hypothetical protein